MREAAKSLRNLARPEGFEPPTLCLEGRRSIRLSYGRAACNRFSLLRLCHHYRGKYFAATIPAPRNPNN